MPNSIFFSIFLSSISEKFFPFQFLFNLPVLLDSNLHYYFGMNAIFEGLTIGTQIPKALVRLNEQAQQSLVYCLSDTSLTD